MNTKHISTIIGIILIIVIGGFVYSQRDNEIKTNTGSNAVLNSQTDCGNGKTDCIGDTSGKTDSVGSNTSTAPKSTVKSYSATEVASHSDKSSCWSIINGNVYDLTSWVPQHPGGEGAILSICGIDGSGAFNNQHGGRSKIANILAGFKIGVAK